MSRAIITLTKVELPVVDLFTEQTEHFYQVVHDLLGCYKVPMNCVQQMSRAPITAVIATDD
jgi:hypothetical protein